MATYSVQWPQASQSSYSGTYTTSTSTSAVSSFPSDYVGTLTQQTSPATFSSFSSDYVGTITQQASPSTLTTLPSNYSSTFTQWASPSTLSSSVRSDFIGTYTPQTSASTESSFQGDYTRNYSQGQPLSSSGHQSLSTYDKFSTRYSLTGVKLGSGKHSDVLQATSKLDSKTYAVKVIPLSTVSESAVVQEVANLRKFKDRNCVEMVDFLHCNEQLPNISAAPPYACIVMEQVNGTRLANKIKGGANPALATQILPQLASVFQAMHSQQIVHRDVWSENIIVDHSGCPILIDFGNSTSQNVSSAEKTVNLPYLSPQICQKQPPSSSDDMWALGLVLTEVITGKHVSSRMGRSDTPLFSQGSLLQQALDEASSIGGSQLGQICKRLLEFEASQRATASEILSLCSSLSTNYQATSRAQPSSYMPQAMLGTSQSVSNIVSSTSPTQNYRPSSSTAGSHAVTPGITGSNYLDYKPGQQVIYQAKSHNGFYQATILERTWNNAWRIQIQGGDIKEVPDAERWRLTIATSRNQ